MFWYIIYYCVVCNKYDCLVWYGNTSCGLCNLVNVKCFSADNKHFDFEMGIDLLKLTRVSDGMLIPLFDITL